MRDIPEKVDKKYNTGMGVTSESQSQITNDARAKIKSGNQTASETRSNLRKKKHTKDSPDSNKKQKTLGFQLPELGQEKTRSKPASISPEDTAPSRIGRSSMMQ